MKPHERLNQFIEEGRLIRDAWTGEKDGRETACLLAALSPEVAKKETASACPAELMPAWFAELTPWIADAGSADAWPGVVRRYAGLAARWHVLTPVQWERLDYHCRRIAVLEARSATDGKSVISACDRVLALLDRAIAGGKPLPGEWEAEAVWADAAWEEAAWEDADAARASAKAAWAAAWAEADAARAAAAAASAKAAWAARAARAAWAEADAAGAAAASAAADRMTTAILDALGSEIVEAENGQAK